MKLEQKAAGVCRMKAVMCARDRVQGVSDRVEAFLTRNIILADYIPDRSWKRDPGEATVTSLLTAFERRMFRDEVRERVQREVRKIVKENVDIVHPTRSGGSQDQRDGRQK